MKFLNYDYEFMLDSDYNTSINWSEFIAKTAERVDVTHILQEQIAQEADTLDYCRCCDSNITSEEDLHELFGDTVCTKCCEEAKRLRIMGVKGSELYHRMFPGGAYCDSYIESLETGDY